MSDKVADPYYVNVSSILDYMQDPCRWVFKWVEGRVPRNEARALRFGKLLHVVFERYLLGTPIKAALESVQREWTAKRDQFHTDAPEWQVCQDALDDLKDLWEPMMLWKDRYPFEGDPLEVEKAFEMPHPLDPSIIMRGRPDRVQMYQGRVYHIQNRSLAAGVNFPLYLRLQRRSYHEHLYSEHIAHTYGNCGGTFFNLYRKLKYRKKATKAQEAKGEPGDVLHTMDEMFWQHPMGIDLSSRLHEHVMKSILYHAWSMRDTEQRYRHDLVLPAPNERLNGGPYGNREDEYYRVLLGEIGLDDNEVFKDREDTYATNQEE